MEVLESTYYIVDMITKLIFVIFCLSIVRLRLKQMVHDGSKIAKDRLISIIRYHDLMRDKEDSKFSYNSSHYIVTRYNKWYVTKITITYVEVLLDEMTIDYTLTKEFDDKINQYVYAIKEAEPYPY